MSLNLKAIDVMTPHVVVASPTMSVVELGKIMNRFRIGGVPVVDKKGALVGIVTERCIMKSVVAKNKKPSSLKVKDVMFKGKMIVGVPGDSVESLAARMNKHDKTRIPIIDKNKVVGIVTNKDIIESAPALIDLIVEQAEMTEAFESERSLSFGTCEKCGGVKDLFYNQNKFMCDDCSGIGKIRRQNNFIKKFFGRN